MRSTNLGDGLLERSGFDQGVPDARKSSAAGSATPWVLLVFALGAGGYFSYDLYGRALNARAAAERADAELKLTRQRAFDAEKKETETAGALATSKAENDRLATDLAELSDVNKKVAAKAEKADLLAAELSRTVAADEGELTAASGKLTLDLLDKVLFRTAKAELTPSGKKVLRRVGDALNRYPDRSIWVIGHTDDKPMKSEQFASNWELSTARALSVVHYLVDEVKVDPRRLAAAGMGPYRPASRSNRARNRRIELVLFPKDVKVQKP